jgi:hypothetical protein
MPSPAAIIRCEIRASRRSTAGDLSAIVHVCAEDLKIRVETQKTVGGVRAKNSILTLHVPVELADQQSQVWCLACRLACFCPNSRVSVLIHSEQAFGPAAPSRARRHSA